MIPDNVDDYALGCACRDLLTAKEFVTLADCTDLITPHLQMNDLTTEGDDYALHAINQFAQESKAFGLWLSQKLFACETYCGIVFRERCSRFPDSRVEDIIAVALKLQTREEVPPSSP